MAGFWALTLRADNLSPFRPVECRDTCKSVSAPNLMAGSPPMLISSPVSTTNVAAARGLDGRHARRRMSTILTPTRSDHRVIADSTSTTRSEMAGFRALTLRDDHFSPHRLTNCRETGNLPSAPTPTRGSPPRLMSSLSSTVIVATARGIEGGYAPRGISFILTPTRSDRRVIADSTSTTRSEMAGFRALTL